MQENKKKMVSLILTVVALLLVVVGATYAYFAAQIENGASTDVNITAESVDSLTFTTGSPINLAITQENFKEGAGNKVVNTSATASLIAGKDKSASYNYYVYLDISKNEFIYTQRRTKEPELLLKITDPDNNEIKELEGLLYNEALGGFDITTENGIIKIAELYNISTTSSKSQTWNLEFTFRNLSTNQVGNSEKSFKAGLLIQKERLADSIAEVCTNGENLAECIKTLSETSVPNASKIYLHDGSNEYDANDGSYRYSGVDNKVAKKYQSEYTYINNDLISPYSNAIYWLSYAEKEDGSYDDYTYFEALDKAISDGYVIGNLVKNYVCFGSDEENCPYDNLYRIIGVFGSQVKLIKADFTTSDLLGTDGAYSSKGVNNYDYFGNLNNTSIGRYTFNPANNGSNDWETSQLNITNLNKNYINNIGTKWSNMIASVNWNIGDNSAMNKLLRDFYVSEKAKQTTTKTKIGLMNLSDYAFASTPKTWKNAMTGMHNSGFANENWLYTSVDEWTLSPSTEATDRGYIFTLTGSGISAYAGTGSESVRPTFYLNSNILYNGGEGTYHSPYRIAV